MPEDVKKAFRALTPEAVETLRWAMASRESYAVKAAEIVLDRAWGKAPQFIDGEVRFGKLSEEERKEKVAEIIAKVTARCLTDEGGEELEGEVFEDADD